MQRSSDGQSLTGAPVTFKLANQSADWFEIMSRSSLPRLVEQLKAHLAEQHHPLNQRLPPERTLSIRLGVSRSSLRKALAVLEAEGQIWRHVGRGTFVGARPSGQGEQLPAISNGTNPAEVMEARLLIEPELARLAALNARPADIDEMVHCIRQTKAAREWRAYELWDHNLHRAIAAATGNALLVSLFDALNAVRRAVVWGRLRTYRLTPELDHHSFAEHDLIFGAIVDRDLEEAARRMREHLLSVRRNLLEPKRRPPPGGQSWPRDLPISRNPLGK
jgi:DNA-binding FadR family transcriptional regulator